MKELDKLDKKTLEVRKLQELLDCRTEIENKAIKLMEECRFNEAIELLATI